MRSIPSAMTKILDGKKLSAKILSELKEEVAGLAIPIRLGIILAGDNPASRAYVNQKQKAGEKIGVEVEVFALDTPATTKGLRREVNRIQRLPAMRGTIVQLPLPKNINTQHVLNAVPWQKDTDVLGERALGKFYVKRSPVLPATTAGIMRLLDEYKIPVKGYNVVIVGAGRLVGRPTALAMMQRNATVTVLNEFTRDIGNFTRDADIVIAGVGKPGLITGDMIKEGAVVIDAGYAKNPKGKVLGDTDFASIKKRASYVTPVPGGVGPMTVAMLFSNLIDLTKLQIK